MEQWQGKIVSIAAFRATRPTRRPEECVSPLRHRPQPPLSDRSLEHRRRMLGFLSVEAGRRRLLR